MSKRFFVFSFFTSFAKKYDDLQELLNIRARITHLNYDTRKMPSHIIDSLYIGNEADALCSDESVLTIADYDLVVNCTSTIPFHASVPVNRRIRIPIIDDPCDADKLLYELVHGSVLADVHKTLTRGGSVLVHCAFGASRSPTVVAAYLIAHRSMTVLGAIEYIKSRRREAFFAGVNFESTLTALHDRRTLVTRSSPARK